MEDAQGEEQLDAFPTSGQPVLNTSLKNMCLSLRGALQHDMANFMVSTLKALGDRVDYVENNMGDFTQAHNELVDAHFEVEEELMVLKLKVADLEDRSKRNNIKF